jgi:hypothetical protein
MVRAVRSLRLIVLAIVILAPTGPLEAAPQGRRPAVKEESMGRQQGGMRVLSRLLIRVWGKPGATVDPSGAAVAGPTAPPVGQAESSAGTDGQYRDDQ